MVLVCRTSVAMSRPLAITMKCFRPSWLPSDSARQNTFTPQHRHWTNEAIISSLSDVTAELSALTPVVVGFVGGAYMNKWLNRSKERQQAVDKVAQCLTSPYVSTLTNLLDYDNFLPVPLPPGILYRSSQLPLAVRSDINCEALSCMLDHRSDAVADEALNAWQAALASDTRQRLRRHSAENSEHIAKYTACFVRALSSAHQVDDAIGAPTTEAVVYREVARKSCHALDALAADPIVRELCKQASPQVSSLLSTLRIFQQPVRLVVPKAHRSRRSETRTNAESLRSMHYRLKRERPDPSHSYDLYMVYLWQDFLDTNGVYKSLLSLIEELGGFDPPPQPEDEKWRRRHVQAQVGEHAFRLDYAQDQAWRSQLTNSDDVDVWWSSGVYRDTHCAHIQRRQAWLKSRQCSQ
eukprot:TRINITY_DN1230_c0_g1_i1.p1 TRINITY_DN1230_c0_g1~~TRINITY_DN1230_c0_g1_i1.p1  ORF type:complete len:421 (+),score=60.86 TRINITY_DN1230_c0_g1_i1:38-1264(+)